MLLLLALACVTDTSILEQEGDDTALSAQERLGLGDAEAGLILDFLNDCATTQSLLDEQVPLDSDTAENLVRHRDGADQSCGTADDDPFDSLDEVDEVPQVGDASIRAILEYLQGGGVAGPDEWEGVAFTAEEQQVVIEICNEASFTELDESVGLTSSAAQNLVDARPHPDMDSIADTPQVGPASLELLRDYVPYW